MLSARFNRKTFGGFLFPLRAKYIFRKRKFWHFELRFDHKLCARTRKKFSHLNKTEIVLYWWKIDKKSWFLRKICNIQDAFCSVRVSTVNVFVDFCFDHKVCARTRKTFHTWTKLKLCVFMKNLKYFSSNDSLLFSEWE